MAQRIYGEYGERKRKEVEKREERREKRERLQPRLLPEREESAGRQRAGERCREAGIREAGERVLPLPAPPERVQSRQRGMAEAVAEREEEDVYIREERRGERR